MCVFSLNPLVQLGDTDSGRHSSTQEKINNTVIYTNGDNNTTPGMSHMPVNVILYN